MARYTETVNTEVGQYGFLNGCKALRDQGYGLEVSEFKSFEDRSMDEPAVETVSPEDYSHEFDLVDVRSSEEGMGELERLKDQERLTEIVLEDCEKDIELKWVDISLWMDSPFANVSLKHSGISESEIQRILGNFTDRRSGYY